MLNSKRSLSALATALLAPGLVVAGAVGPAAANTCHTDDAGNQVCNVETGTHGNPGPNPGPGAGPADFTPGPTSCVDRFAKPASAEIPCSNGKDWWDNARQCYWTLDDPQRSAPGRDPSVGAFYSCDPLPSFCAAVKRPGSDGDSRYLIPTS